nr:hypothetical protein [Saccharopolyspora pogona]
MISISRDSASAFASRNPQFDSEIALLAWQRDHDFACVRARLRRAGHDQWRDVDDSVRGAVELAELDQVAVQSLRSIRDQVWLTRGVREFNDLCISGSGDPKCSQDAGHVLGSGRPLAAFVAGYRRWCDVEQFSEVENG